ncbi:hypothetical protein FQA39_LY16189 [Lamprigera yunnana]|nr:hypothetical protein FQA39_LY16189 [Lamprigera yunnana]
MTRTPPVIGKEMPGKEAKSPKKVRKQKANNSPLMVRQAALAEPNPELMKLKKKIGELVKYGKANKNVHVEVKKTANEFNLLINPAIGCDRRRICEIVDKQKEEQEKSMENKETKEVGTQTYEGEEGRNLERINEDMKEGERDFKMAREGNGICRSKGKQESMERGKGRNDERNRRKTNRNAKAEDRVAGLQGERKADAAEVLHLPRVRPRDKGMSTREGKGWALDDRGDVAIKAAKGKLPISAKGIKG